jgi:hypothetical protein
MSEGGKKCGATRRTIPRVYHGRYDILPIHTNIIDQAANNMSVAQHGDAHGRPIPRGGENRLTVFCLEGVTRVE